MYILPQIGLKTGLSGTPIKIENDRKYVYITSDRSEN